MAQQQQTPNASMPLPADHDGMPQEAVPVDPEGINPQPQGMPNARMPLPADHANASMPLPADHDGMPQEAVPVDPEGINPQPQGMPNARMPLPADHAGMPQEAVAVDPEGMNTQPQGMPLDEIVNRVCHWYANGGYRQGVDPQGMPLEDAAVAVDCILPEPQGMPQALEPVAPEGMNADIAGYEAALGVEEATALWYAQRWQVGPAEAAVWAAQCMSNTMFTSAFVFEYTHNAVAGQCLAVSNAESNRTYAVNLASGRAGQRINLPSWSAFDVYWYPTSNGHMWNPSLWTSMDAESLGLLGELVSRGLAAAGIPPLEAGGMRTVPPGERILERLRHCLGVMGVSEFVEVYAGNSFRGYRALDVYQRRIRVHTALPHGGTEDVGSMRAGTST